MSERDNYGIPVILGDLHRSKDWCEPYPEGEWLCVCEPAGDDDER